MAILTYHMQIYSTLADPFSVGWYSKGSSPPPLEILKCNSKPFFLLNLDPTENKWYGKSCIYYITGIFLLCIIDV